MTDDATTARSSSEPTVTPTVTAVPGRYIPADAATVSRRLAAAGLKRQAGSGDGFSVRRNTVEVSCRWGPAGRLERGKAEVVAVLRACGYLVVPTGSGSSFEVYRRVANAAHDGVFYAQPWAAKVVDADGSVRKASADPATKAVVAERKAAVERRDVEERAVKKRGAERRDALIAAFGELGVEAGRHSGRFVDSTDIQLSVDAGEKLLELVRAARASSPAPWAVPGGVDGDGFHRRPTSSCCGAGLVARHPDTGLYVSVSDVQDFAGAVRCGRCNREVASVCDPVVAAADSAPPARPDGDSNRAIVHRLLLAAAKARSGLAEAGTLNIGLSPFLDDGPRCILPALSALDGRAEPPTFTETLNMLAVANGAEPNIGICAVGYGGVPTVEEFMGRHLPRRVGGVS